MPDDRTKDASPRRSRRSESTSDLIINSARKVFARSDYAGSSIDDVAAGCNLTKATIYYHFNSKEALYEATQVAYLGDAHRRLEAILASEQAPALLIREVIADFCRDTSSRDLRSITYQEPGSLSASAHAAIRNAQRGYERALADLIQRGQTEGQFRCGDPKIIAFILIGSVASMNRWYDPTGPLTADEIETIIATLLLSGLLTDSARAELNAPDH